MRKFTTYSECKISDKIEQLFVNIIISKNFNLIKFALDLGILNIINKFNPDFTWLRFNRIFAKHCLKIKESEIHQYSCDSESEIENGLMLTFLKNIVVLNHILKIVEN